MPAGINKRTGRLKKGYRYKKGGKVIKAKAAPARKKRTPARKACGPSKKRNTGKGKLRTGPKGGRYYMRKGRRVYC